MSQSTAQDQGYFERQNNEGGLFEDANKNFSFRDNEEFDYDLSYSNQEPKKNNQQTNCQVEQQPITLLGVMQEVCKKQEPEIIKTILELNEDVNELRNQKSLMSKGNGVYKFIECLENQEKSKQTLSETIMLEMKNILKQRIDFEMQMLYNNSVKLYQDFVELYEEIELTIKKKIDLDFTDLNYKTIKQQKKCSQVHVQKRIPEQIPSIIQEIFQSQNLNKNILDSAREVEPFINECTCILRKQRVLKIKQLKQKLSSNQFQLFINFIEILKENTDLFIFDRQWDDTEKVEILEKFKLKIMNAKEKRFPSVDAINENNSSSINRNSKKIKKSN